MRSHIILGVHIQAQGKRNRRLSSLKYIHSSNEIRDATASNESWPEVSKHSTGNIIKMLPHLKCHDSGPHDGKDMPPHLIIIISEIVWQTKWRCITSLCQRHKRRGSWLGQPGCPWQQGGSSREWLTCYRGGGRKQGNLTPIKANHCQVKEQHFQINYFI